MKKAIWLVISFVICFSFASAGKKTYEYSGQTITDRKTGFAALGDTTHGIMVVSNYKDNYAMILQYFTNWKFFINDNDYLLYGTAGKTVVSLSKVDTDKSPKEFLEQIADPKDTSNKVPGLIYSEIIEHKGLPVLKKIIDGELASNNIFSFYQYNYFSAKKHGDDLYVFHLSILVEKTDTLNFKDKLFLSFATDGFTADFKMKAKQ